MTTQAEQGNQEFSRVQPKGSWEIPRKLYHFSIGFLSIFLYDLGYGAREAVPVLSAILFIVLTGELVRFNSPRFNRMFCKVLGPLMRQSEIDMRINGTAYYLAGCIIVLNFYPTDIAAMSIVYLSWADPTASVCGRLWGKYTPRYGGKTLAGSLGAFFAGMLVTILFNSPWSHFSLSYHSDSSPVPLTLLSIYGGLVTSFSEGISDLAFGLDDNLTIPVLSATLMWIPLVYFGLGV